MMRGMIRDQGEMFRRTEDGIVGILTISIDVSHRSSTFGRPLKHYCP